MPPEKAQSERVAAGPRMSPKKARELLEYKPSAETLVKMRKQKRKVAGIHLAESVSREAEAKALRALKIALGSGEGTIVEETSLNEDQKNILRKSIEEVEKEDKLAVREIMRSLNVQESFKEQYKNWKEAYDASPDLQKKYPEFNDYAKEQGILFIKQMRHTVTEVRLRAAYDKHADKQGLNEDQQEEAKDRLYKSVDMYIQAHRQEMVVYGSLDEVRQKDLYAKFSEIMKQNGFADVDPVVIREIFDIMVGDLQYEVLVIQEYEATYEEFVEMAPLNLSDEEWEERRQKALKKNAKDELKEYLNQQVQPVYAYLPLEAGPPVSFSSIKEVANASGVNLRPAEGKGENVFYVNFPAIKDRKFMPLLKVIYPKGSNNINDAIFVFEEPWADKDSAKGPLIEETPTREFSAVDVPMAVNALILDYILNEGIKTKVPVKGDTGVNDIISDQNMIHVAERLFGFGLREKRILDREIDLYRRFLTIVLRDDGKSSLQDRFKKVRNVIDNDSLLPYFKEAMNSKGAVGKTLDKIIEEAKDRMAGKIK